MATKGITATVARNRPVPLKPIRMKPRTAAEYLDVEYRSVLKLIHMGVFTIKDNGKRGLGRHIHLLTDEIEVYAEKGAAAVKEYRRKKGRLKTR
jgi:hypothetical protein